MKKTSFILFALFCFNFSVAQTKVTKKPPGEDTTVYIIAEQMPQFQGGDSALAKYLSDSVIYPEFEKQNKIEGRVFATFVVSKEGLVTKPTILKGVAGAKNFDAEVIRVLKNMPAWIPGKQNGKIVKVQFMLPFNFHLNTINDSVSHIKSKSVVSASKVTVDSATFKTTMITFTELLDNPEKDKYAPAYEVDFMPYFSGGNWAFMKYLTENVKYEKSVYEEIAPCIVDIGFVINKKGKAENVKILSSQKTCKDFATNLVNAISASPTWTSAINDGNPIDFYYSVPFYSYWFLTENSARQLTRQIQNYTETAFYKEGKNAMESENWNKAIKKFSNSLVVMPDDDKVYLNRGICKLKLNDIEGACDDFKAASLLGNKESVQLINKNCKSEIH